MYVNDFEVGTVLVNAHKHFATFFLFAVVINVFFTSAKEVMFCRFLFVCLFVCLCVSKITRKVMDGSFRNFEGMSGMA